MGFKNIVSLMVFSVFVCAAGAEVFAFGNESSLNGLGIHDGEYIWTIPNRENEFSKVHARTGERSDISTLGLDDALNKLSGYSSGVLYIDEQGERYICLTPFETSKPFTRINLRNMKIDYPVGNVGYHYGSCQLVSRDGVDYLWMFPSKTKLAGAPDDTEIVVINLTANRKECAISTKIDKADNIFTETIKLGEEIWLLPATHGQPIMKLDTTEDIENLASENVEKIYPGNIFGFSRITSGVFDGAYVWLVCVSDDLSSSEYFLARCDIDGNLVERIDLTGERFANSAVADDFIYRLAGLDGRESMLFAAYDKDGVPVIKIVESPEIILSAETDKKVYRDYGDVEKGCEIGLQFDAPDGFRLDNVYWHASNEPYNGDKEHGAAQVVRDELFKDENRINVEELSYVTFLAGRNGEYAFLAEFVSFDETVRLYSTATLKIDNIYERLPIFITRYDIDDTSDNPVIERVTHNEDFGAAFSYDGSEFIEADEPMELVPAREVSYGDKIWGLDLPQYHIINLLDGDITTETFRADLDVIYRVVGAAGNSSDSSEIKSIYDFGK